MDNLYQCDEYVVVGNKKNRPVLWVTNGFGVDLRKPHYRRVERYSSSRHIREEDTFEEMFYDAENSIALLVDFTNCNAVMYGATDYRGGIGCKALVNESREAFMQSIRDMYIKRINFDIGYLYEGVDLNRNVIPLMRMEEFDKAREKCGLSTFGSNKYPKVYKRGTEEYNKWYTGKVDFKPTCSFVIETKEGVSAEETRAMAGKLSKNITKAKKECVGIGYESDADAAMDLLKFLNFIAECIDGEDDDLSAEETKYFFTSYNEAAEETGRELIPENVMVLLDDKEVCDALDDGGSDSVKDNDELKSKCELVEATYHKIEDLVDKFESDNNDIDDERLEGMSVTEVLIEVLRR